MSLIKQIQVAMRDKSLVVTESYARSLRAYFNNGARNHRAPITEMNKQLFARGPFPINPVYNASSVEWFQKLFLKLSGIPRETEQVRRLSSRQIEVVQNLSHFLFVGMVEEWEGPSVDYETRYHAGHEKLATFNVWRAVAKDGRYFDYYNKPWQQHYCGSETGVFLFPSEGGV